MPCEFLLQCLFHFSSHCSQKLQEVNEAMTVSIPLVNQMQKFGSYWALIRWPHAVPSLSNREKAPLNSGICPSVSCSSRGWGREVDQRERGWLHWHRGCPGNSGGKRCLGGHSGSGMCSARSLPSCGPTRLLWGPGSAHQAPSTTALPTVCFKTLTFWHEKMFQAPLGLSLPGHGRTISLKSPGSFCWRMVCRNPDLGTHCFGFLLSFLCGSVPDLLLCSEVHLFGLLAQSFMYCPSSKFSLCDLLTITGLEMKHFSSPESMIYQGGTLKGHYRWQALLLFPVLVCCCFVPSLLPHGCQQCVEKSRAARPQLLVQTT